MELWKPVSEFPEHYEISSLCRLRRIKSGGGARVGRISLPTRMKIGYGKFNLWVNGKEHQRYAHRLLMDAFVGPCAHKMTVNHKNGIRYDNRLENLEYATSQEQILHSIAVLGNSLGTRGEKHPKSKLTWENVREIRENPNKLTRRQFEKKFGVHYSTIRAAETGAHWRSS